MDNLLGQVKFSAALQRLTEWQQSTSSRSTLQTFIEIGPHAALAGPLRQTLAHFNPDELKYSYLSTLVRNQNAVSTVLDVCGKLFESGLKMNSKNILSLSGSTNAEVITDLAPYAWDHSKTYWSEPRARREYRLRQHAKHDILGSRNLEASTVEPVWRNILTVGALPWLQDHVVDGMVVFPGAGYLCMALEAARQINLDRSVPGKALNYKIRDVSFSKALVITDGGSVETQLTLKPSVNDRGSSTWEDFKILSVSSTGVWTEHCRGSIMTEFESNIDEVEGSREFEIQELSTTQHLESVKSSCQTRVEGTDLYKLMEDNGNSYGPTFAAVQHLYHGDKEAISTITVPDIAAQMPSHFMSMDSIHPATLDAAFHIDVFLFNEFCGTKGVMPISIGEITVSARFDAPAGSDLTVTTSFDPEGPRSATFHSRIYQDNKSIISLKNAALLAIGQSQGSNKEEPFSNQGGFEIQWDRDVDFIAPDVIVGAPHKSASGLSLEEQVDLLETVAAHYVRRAIEQIDEARHTPAKKHHAALVNWMRRHQASSEYAKFLNNGLDLETCLKRLEGSGPEIELLSNVGAHLGDILQGNVDGLELMTQGDVLDRFYTGNMWLVQCNAHIAQYMKLASFKDPHLKVLEIGAGTGSATIPTLKAVTSDHGTLLSGFTFTDISPAFFERVRSSLEQWSDLINYKVLDIEKDPIAQGFEEGAYDVVTGSFVLHATSHIPTTLNHIRKLLKPGGRLVMIELCKVTAWLNCVFGITTGWWAGKNFVEPLDRKS